MLKMPGIWAGIKKIKLKPWVKLLLIIVIFSTAFSMFGIGSLQYIEQPQFCTLCHSMRAYHSSWERSGHSQVNCFSCHGEIELNLEGNDSITGGEGYTLSRDMLTTNRAVKVFGKIVDKMTVYVKVISDYADKKKKQLMFLYNMSAGRSDHSSRRRAWDNCITCHEGFIFSRSGNDHFGHFTHAGSGVITCRQCHGNLVHEQKTKITRETCLNCHDNEIATPPSHVPASFKTSHGKDYLSKGECGLCHVRGVQEPICQDCHKVEMPHPENYRKDHIPAITEVGVRTCFKCHQEEAREEQVDGKPPAGSAPDNKASCSVCHRREMPHTDNVLKEHSALAKSSGLQSCSYCHQTSPGQKDMAVACADCHELEIPHPKDFKYRHKESVALKGQGVCNYCHSPMNPVNPGASWAKPGFCMNCHLKNKPHESGFKSEHQLGNYDRNRCITCHPVVLHCNDCHFGE